MKCALRALTHRRPREQAALSKIEQYPAYMRTVARGLWFCITAMERESEMVEFTPEQIDAFTQLRAALYGKDSETSEAVQSVLLEALLAFSLREFFTQVDVTRDPFVAFTHACAINSDTGEFAGVQTFTHCTAALTYIARLALLRDCLRIQAEVTPPPHLGNLLEERLHLIRTAKPTSFHHMRM